MKINFHTHSHYCDGKGELREYVEYAIAHGFDQLGFSGHAPVPFENTFAMSDDGFLQYCDEVRALKQEYADRIALFLGLEIDYMPGVLDNFDVLTARGGLDYFIGGVHQVNNPDGDPYELWFIDGSRQETYDEGLQRVFGGDIRRGVKAFFHQTNAMIENTRPPIIAHFNKIVMHNKGRYFNEDEKWYRDLAFETVDLIHDTGCIAEVNTRGLYKKRHHDFYPSKEIIGRMKELGIPVLVGSDAHEPTNLDMFEGAYEYLEAIGYPAIVRRIEPGMLLR